MNTDDLRHIGAQIDLLFRENEELRQRLDLIADHLWLEFYEPAQSPAMGVRSKKITGEKDDLPDLHRSITPASALASINATLERIERSLTPRSFVFG